MKNVEKERVEIRDAQNNYQEIRSIPKREWPLQEQRLFLNY